jgi:hypothetical protein
MGMATSRSNLDVIAERRIPPAWVSPGRLGGRVRPGKLLFFIYILAEPVSGSTEQHRHGVGILNRLANPERGHP